MMNAIKSVKIISFVILFSLPLTVLFSQSDEAVKILESSKGGVVTLMALGANNEVLGEGSGFFVEQGVIATCYHLVSKAASVTGKNAKGKNLKIEGVLGVDKKLNLALLSVKGKAQSLAYGNSDELESGKKVFAVGSNESGEIMIAEGEAKNMFEIDSIRKVVQTSLDVPMHFNGAPLLGENGQVMGMIIFFERRFRITLTSNSLKTMEKQSLIKFKDWKPEDYMETEDAAYFAGKTSFLLDELGRAQLYLEKLSRTRPDDIEIHSILASSYESIRNYDMALKSYEKVIELDSNRHDAYYGLGMLLINMRQFENAMPHLEKAVALNPDYTGAYFYIGSAHQDLRNFDKAAQAYEKFLESRPENAWETYYRLGICQNELQQFESAIASFQEALKEKPQEVRIYSELAKAFEQSKQYDNAETAYMKIAELMPEDKIRLYRATLMMYDKARMSDKAIEIARQITELDPNSHENFYNLGYMYMNAKKYNEAIEAFNSALAINPNYDYAIFNIGVCYSNMNKHKSAINAFNRLVKIVPDNTDAWFYIGISYMQLKDFNSALEPLKKTVELRPDYANALYNLAITYLNLKDNYSAREVHKKLKAINPSLAQKLEQWLR
jgi:tetratricopeptide (TPR) repeat protein